MDIATMLASVLAVGLNGLALGLCILFRMRTKAPWAKLLVAFLSVSLGLIVLASADRYTSFSLSVLGMEKAAQVTSIVLKSILLGCAFFLLLFLPFFTGMVLGRPRMEKRLWILLSGLGAFYVAWGILRFFFDFFWIRLIQFLIFFGTYFFCLISLWANVSKIKAKTTRRIIVAANIVSISLSPAAVLASVFPGFEFASYSLYSMAFSIVMLVYFYSFFTIDFKEASRAPRALTLEDLKKYHISEREFSVISLLSQGLTNKEIGGKLGISVNTVNNHVANVFSKTGVRSRVDLLNLMREAIR